MNPLGPQGPSCRCRDPRGLGCFLGPGRRLTSQRADSETSSAAPQAWAARAGLRLCSRGLCLLQVHSASQGPRSLSATRCLYSGTLSPPAPARDWDRDRLLHSRCAIRVLLLLHCRKPPETQCPRTQDILLHLSRREPPDRPRGERLPPALLSSRPFPVLRASSAASSVPSLPLPPLQETS